MEKEIISKFKEKPKTKTAWRTMVLGLGAFLVGPMFGIVTAIIRPIVDKESMVGRTNNGVAIGFNGMMIAFILAIAALITGVRAFKKGERSWVLCVGLVPAVLVIAFCIFIIIGESLFPH